MNNKYSNFLTILLILIIIAIIAIIAFLGFKYYETYITKSEAEDFVETWGEDTQNKQNGNNTNIIPDNEIQFEGVDEGNNTNETTSSNDKVKRFNGFIISGTIEIPTTNLKSPIIAQSEYSPKALETAIVETYGPGLNKVGNTTVTISTTNNIKKTFNVNIVNILDTGDYDFEDGFISGISPGTNYNNFIEDLSANTINLYANGKVVNDINTIIGTNMKIEVSNGTEKMTYTLIVRGDVNGDGYVKMNDVMDIAKYIVELDGISGNYLVAADVTKDDNVKMNDVMKIAKYLVEGGTL